MEPVVSDRLFFISPICPLLLPLVFGVCRFRSIYCFTSFLLRFLFIVIEAGLQLPAHPHTDDAKSRALRSSVHRQTLDEQGWCAIWDPPENPNKTDLKNSGRTGLPNTGL
jgi:hypothetical protein